MPMATEGTKVIKRIVVAVTLAFLVALSSAYAQTTDFFELVKTGTPRSIQAAIDQGADVNARDKDGATALMEAADHSQNPEVIATLLKAGADIKARIVSLLSMNAPAKRSYNPARGGVAILAGVVTPHKPTRLHFK